MANLNSWSLREFRNAFGKMKVTPKQEFVNSKTGEKFMASSCVFLHPTKKDDQGRQLATFVGFAQSLGEMTPAEIAQDVDNLQVVFNEENQHYYLCHYGDSSWMDVDF
jgi:hypothetical protein